MSRINSGDPSRQSNNPFGKLVVSCFRNAKWIDFDERESHPKSAISREINEVQDMVMKDRRLTADQLAMAIGISYGTVH